MLLACALDEIVRERFKFISRHSATNISWKTKPGVSYSNPRHENTTEVLVSLSYSCHATHWHWSNSNTFCVHWFRTSRCVMRRSGHSAGRWWWSKKIAECRCLHRTTIAVKYDSKTFVCDNVFMIIVLCEVQGRFRVHLSGWQPQKLCSASLCDMGRIVSCTSSLLNMIFFADSSAKDATREGVQNICWCRRGWQKEED